MKQKKGNIPVMPCNHAVVVFLIGCCWSGLVRMVEVSIVSDTGVGVAVSCVNIFDSHSVCDYSGGGGVGVG